MSKNTKASLVVAATIVVVAVVASIAFAWTADSTAMLSCNQENGHVYLNATFTNNEPVQEDTTMAVTASGGLGSLEVDPGDTANFNPVDLGVAPIAPGSVTFTLVWADGHGSVEEGNLTDTRTSNYEGIETCGTPPPPPVDVCLNIEGNQETVPEGLILNGTICVEPPPPDFDACTNIEGIQETVPLNYVGIDGVCQYSPTIIEPPSGGGGGGSNPPPPPPPSGGGGGSFQVGCIGAHCNDGGTYVPPPTEPPVVVAPTGGAKGKPGSFDNPLPIPPPNSTCRPLENFVVDVGTPGDGKVELRWSGGDGQPVLVEYGTTKALGESITADIPGWQGLAGLEAHNYWFQITNLCSQSPLIDPIP